MATINLVAAGRGRDHQGRPDNDARARGRIADRQSDRRVRDHRSAAHGGAAAACASHARRDIPDHQRRYPIYGWRRGSGRPPRAIMWSSRSTLRTPSPIPFDEPAVFFNSFTPAFYVNYFRELEKLVAGGPPPRGANRRHDGSLRDDHVVGAVALSERGPTSRVRPRRGFIPQGRPGGRRRLAMTESERFSWRV